MTISYVLMQNLRRNPLRSGLTMVAFALPMAIFVAAISFVVAIAKVSEANAKALRIAVHHKTTIINMLPGGDRMKIEALDPQHQRITAVCGMRWFGGKVANAQNVVMSMGADADTFPYVYSDAEMSAKDVEAWQRDRQACVIGYGLAATYHWGLGQRITLKSTVPPYLDLEFHVIKVMKLESRANALYFRRDYQIESLKAAGVANYADCNVFWIRSNGVQAMRSIQKEIDATFANTPDETKTEDENAFGASFAQAAGDLPGLMRVMAIVVVAIIALVAGNTMMMSFRERTQELGVFKAIGFPNWRLVSIVLGESMVLALIGAAIGIVPTTVILILFPVRNLGLPMVNSMDISPRAVILSVGIALAVGVAAGLLPAWQALRLRTVNALRRTA